MQPISLIREEHEVYKQKLLATDKLNQWQRSETHSASEVSFFKLSCVLFACLCSYTAPFTTETECLLFAGQHNPLFREPKLMGWSAKSPSVATSLLCCRKYWWLFVCHFSCTDYKYMWLHSVFSIPGMNPIGLSHAGTPGNLSWSFLGWKRRVIQWLECYSRPWKILLVISSQYFCTFFSVRRIVSWVPMCKTKVTALHKTPWRLAYDVPSAEGKTANESKPYKNYCWYPNPSNSLRQFLLLLLSHTDA